MGLFSNIGAFIKDKAGDIADSLNLDTRSILNKEKLSDFGNAVKTSVTGGVKVATGQSSLKDEIGSLLGGGLKSLTGSSGFGLKNLTGSVVPLNQNSPPLNVASGIVSVQKGTPQNSPVLFDDVRNEGISPVWAIVAFVVFLVLKKMRVI